MLVYIVTATALAIFKHYCLNVVKNNFKSPFKHYLKTKNSMFICQTFISIKCRINFNIVCSLQFWMLNGDFLMQQMFIEHYNSYCIKYGVNSDHILGKTLDFLGHAVSGWHHSALW